jgi:carbonic anhydrase
MIGFVTRRALLRALSLGSLGTLVGATPAVAIRGGGGCPTVGIPAGLLPSQADSPEEILNKLIQGNHRYVANDLIPHERSFDQGLEVDPVAGQRPAAMILSCADSRAVPELIFDQPRARLFVCRIAGNYATDEMIGSLEFGAFVLGAKVLIVMGHSACGAVENTITLIREGAGAFPPPILASKIPGVLTGLRPPVQKVIDSFPPGTPAATLLRPATEEVARQNAQLLATQEPILAPRFEDGTLAVAAAYYDIDSGVVTFL